jgi:hypothetical protein
MHKVAAARMKTGRSAGSFIKNEEAFYPLILNPLFPELNLAN